VRNEEIRRKIGLQKLELMIEDRRLRWLGHVLTENGGLQNNSSGYAVGAEGLQEKAGTATEKLDGHHRTRFEGHGHHLG